MAKRNTKITVPEGTKVPDHIMIIPDGNRRWARARGVDTLEGHKAGFEITTKLGRAARDMGVHTLSLWGFSTENWDRTPREINYLMKLYETLVDRHLKEALEEGVRIIHLGRKDRLPKVLMDKINDAEEKTKNNQNYVLNICLDHGGRDEVARAVNRYVAARESGEEDRPMSEEIMMDYLDTAGQPYPYVDLVIRTSGEQRTSGMLLWQAAYAEMYWEIDHFPDFGPEKLREAVLDYSRRRRRFGGNDAEEHLKFDPKLVARLEVDFRREMEGGREERFQDLVIKYVKAQYGLSKDLAKSAGLSLARALRHGKSEDWKSAKLALMELYGVVKKNLNLALEPEIVANIEVDLWRSKQDQGLAIERQMRQLYAETYRFSDLQASKAAHLANLAKTEIDARRWERANWYLERFYTALKERVA